MHARYVILNLVFLLPLAAFAWNRRHSISPKLTLRTLFIMCLLTLVFDNLMIAAGVMVYDPAHTLGIKLGLAPLEDFAYTLAAVLIVASFWKHTHAE